MEIGQKLKKVRTQSGYTQEAVAEKINVSRQTISNWENEKSYPDILSVIELSDLYSISLDDLLKGDRKMIAHLEESTNIVKSNKKLIGAIIGNIILAIVMIAFSMLLPQNIIYLVIVFSLMVISTSILLYQIIKRL
ncbi:MAG: helix-turn-helix transcriptional regulator [Lachnospiraceae bacterium]